MDTGKPRPARAIDTGARSAHSPGPAAVAYSASGPNPGEQPRDIDRWFADCVAPHARQYFWLARRMMGDNDAARDLVHDAYATLFATGTWRSISYPRAYVMRTIFTLGLKRIRRAKVVPMHGLPDLETLEFAAHAPDGFQALSIREEMRIGLDAINSLPPVTRQVITMRRLEGLAIKEIAARLDLSVKGVDYHIARGAYLFTKAIEAVHLEGSASAGAEKRYGRNDG